MNFIMDGGPIFMVPLLTLMIVIIILFAKGLKNNTEKTHKLINSLALFSFVFGVLGFVIGMLGALDDISHANNIAPQVLAGGFKIGLLSPTFGMVIFLIGKLFTIILTSMKK
ncbi:MotA/TolQ/ExbB proton channel family protein [Polaribacter vadi]|uniref:MotA/TolQ/ExbB proton channel family protein n=1 Tax=Polaribacter TaxID=52959 RepID=UPI001C0895FE|nr:MULTISPECIES: MotA/TolQ/ExbB proton channel family protein [Polaribacter]MBU3009928.1 MotA/TolQ/ExbB proton channel family protein [Polaribacter vadi]MDO6739734.1 MotA/TolQ/ExbB proton channel family protein [Polaribacter sp. 1_MG-2023]